MNVFRLLADATVVAHAAFAVFVVAGGLLVARWRRVAWVHVPAAAWGIAIEYGGWICPLTPLENWLREGGGDAAYPGDFVAYYVLPALYPEGLTRTMQVVLGTAVLAVNVIAYWPVFRRHRHRHDVSS
ncbi:MAG: DUF2784 domain-containing protein [Acidobacteria bacterium]|nr:DUF2784 domain-containing protein [Acidobacteriota bacterium]